MVDFMWRILNMKNNSSNGGVFEVEGVCSGVRSKVDAQNQTHTYELSERKISLFSPDPENQSFTSLSDLTEEQVLQWVWTTVDKSTVEQMIADDLQATYFNESVDYTIPWASAE